MKRTEQQSKALWKFFELLASALNDAGYTQKSVLENAAIFDIPCTKEFTHDIWTHFQRHLYKTKSTKDLEKIGQIEEVHKVVMKNMGEIFHIEFIEFPSMPEGSLDKDGKVKIGNY